VKAKFDKLWYRLWLFFGGRRTESGFVFLSQDIQSNRKLISKLQSRNAELELRVWELEGHTVEETMAMTRDKINQWTNAEAAGGNDGQ